MALSFVSGYTIHRSTPQSRTLPIASLTVSVGLLQLLIDENVLNLNDLYAGMNASMFVGAPTNPSDICKEFSTTLMDVENAVSNIHVNDIDGMEMTSVEKELSTKRSGGGHPSN